jgi:hypothetical protein
MPVQRVAANPNVKANTGHLAIQRGPLVYCLEACDHGEPLATLVLPREAELTTEQRSDLLGGVVVVKGFAEVVPDQDWANMLYQAIGASRKVPFQAIPYFGWDNRKPGAMKVWMPSEPRSPAAGGLESQAKVSLSFVSRNCQPWGVNDGLEPQSSGEQPAAVCHWWPHSGSQEWVQYNWKQPVNVKGAKVYWFDDTGRGACRLPASWRIDYLDGKDWKPVVASGEYSIKKDGWCALSFSPVQTAALRLYVQLQKGWAAGVHEWKVEEGDED